MMTLTPPGGQTHLLAFTTCRRFNGRFYLRPNRIEVVVDTEGLALEPGETLGSRRVSIYTAGANREALLATARRSHQSESSAAAVPVLRRTGWCSWYCFGPRVTAQHVLDNLDAIAKQMPGLKYVQIDDGYQPRDGRLARDRQRPSAATCRACCKQIRDAGLRAGDLGGAVHRRGRARTSSSSIPTGS